MIKLEKQDLSVIHNEVKFIFRHTSVHPIHEYLMNVQRKYNVLQRVYKFSRGGGYMIPLMSIQNATDQIRIESWCDQYQNASNKSYSLPYFIIHALNMAIELLNPSTQIYINTSFDNICTDTKVGKLSTTYLLEDLWSISHNSYLYNGHLLVSDLYNKFLAYTYNLKT